MGKCYKVNYKTEQRAISAKEEVLLYHPERQLNVYYCDKCEAWHLGGNDGLGWMRRRERKKKVEREQLLEEVMKREKKRKIRGARVRRKIIEEEKIEEELLSMFPKGQHRIKIL